MLKIDKEESENDSDRAAAASKSVPATPVKGGDGNAGDGNSLITPVLPNNVSLLCLNQPQSNVNPTFWSTGKLSCPSKLYAGRTNR